MLKLLLAPFKVLFKILGVNYNQLYAILKVKLTMDNRRDISFSKSGSSTKSQIIIQTLSYVFLGLLFVLVMIGIPSTLLGYTIFFSMMMVMIAFAMISEFTTLLFDVRDNAILVSRPVNNETLAAAKVFHIAIYLLRISLSLAFGVIVYTLFKFGIAATLLFLVLLIFTSFFVLFLTNIFYFVLSNLVSSQRLKDIVVYMQVAMAVIFMGAYQFLPRLMDYYDVKHMGDMVLQWWQLFIPPVWISGTLDIVIHNTFDLMHIVFMIFAIAIPILSLILVVKVLSPRFNKAVQNEDRIQKSKKTVKKVEHKKGWIAALARMVTTNQQEAACFHAVWKMSGRERKYKQTAFPMFGYLFIFIAMYVFKSGEEISLTALRASSRYMVFLYFPMLLSYNLIVNLSFTEHKKSSWFFQTMPIDSVGIVLRGALKAVFLKYFSPVFLLLAVCCFYIWGEEIADDVLLALLINLMVMVLIQRTYVHALPFTIEKSANEMGSNLLRGLMLMVGIFVIFGILVGVSFIDYGSSVAIVLVGILLFVLFKGYDKMDWKRIYF